jgi:hypothetical protein
MACSVQIASNGHCSALVKLTGNFSELFFAHSSWFTYQSMLRVAKFYNFAFSDPNTGSQEVQFSSYPGVLSSLDDFYMMPGSRMAMVQTTNSIYNESRESCLSRQSSQGCTPWPCVALGCSVREDHAIRGPCMATVSGLSRGCRADAASPPCFCHCCGATACGWRTKWRRLGWSGAPSSASTTLGAWIGCTTRGVDRRRRSLPCVACCCSTYTNQYAVISLANFSPGAAIHDGLLVVAEQIPGLVTVSRQCRVLVLPGLCWC